MINLAPSLASCDSDSRGSHQPRRPTARRSEPRSPPTVVRYVSRRRTSFIVLSGLEGTYAVALTAPGLFTALLRRDPARRRRAIGSASLRQRRCSSSVRWQAALRGHRARASDAPGSAESHFVRREGDEDRWLPRRVARTPGSNAATLVRIILGLCAGGSRRVAV